MSSSHQSTLQQFLAGKKVYGVFLEQLPAFWSAGQHGHIVIQTGPQHEEHALSDVFYDAGGAICVCVDGGLLVAKIYCLQLFEKSH